MASDVGAGLRGSVVGVGTLDILLTVHMERRVGNCRGIAHRPGVTHLASKAQAQVLAVTSTEPPGGVTGLARHRTPRPYRTTGTSCFAVSVTVHGTAGVAGCIVGASFTIAEEHFCPSIPVDVSSGQGICRWNVAHVARLTHSHPRWDNMG
mgnify:CR=1 FL=1